MARKAVGKGKQTKGRTTPMEREVAVPTSIGDLSPASRVWVAVAVLPRASREEILDVAKQLGVKGPAAATQAQLARYGAKMANLAKKLPADVKAKILHAGEAAKQHAEG